MKKSTRKKTSLREISVKAFWLLCFLCSLLLNAHAGYLQPTVAYITDSQGNAMVGTNVTISTWPPTNAITGVGTNLIANVAIVDTTGAGGLISNNLAVGNYRLQIPGYQYGVPFGVYSNATPINIAQVAGVPVPVYANFQLQQFSNVGSIAYQPSNNFVLNSYVGVSNAVGFVLATNGGTLSVSQLPYIPATTTTAGVDWSLGYIPETNSLAALLATFNFQPATNLGPVAVSQLPYVPGTNNVGAIPNGSMITNFGVVWLVYQTNALMGTTLTNLPNGSLCTTTNGAFEVLSNATWLIK